MNSTACDWRCWGSSFTKPLLTEPQSVSFWCLFTFSSCKLWKLTKMFSLPFEAICVGKHRKSSVKEHLFNPVTIWETNPALFCRDLVSFHGRTMKRCVQNCQESFSNRKEKRGKKCWGQSPYSACSCFLFQDNNIDSPSDRTTFPKSVHERKSFDQCLVCFRWGPQLSVRGTASRKAFLLHHNNFSPKALSQRDWKQKAAGWLHSFVEKQWFQKLLRAKKIHFCQRPQLVSVRRRCKVGRKTWRVLAHLNSRIVSLDAAKCIYI